MSLARLRKIRDAVIQEVSRRVVGMEEVTSLVLCCILARGHAVLEGVPGLAKTLLARTIAEVTGAKWHKIPFTPDKLPSHILGSEVYNPRTTSFEVRWTGFSDANLVLADEINRGLPRTQSAMLEAMMDMEVTIGDKTRKLPGNPDGGEPGFFTVLATQNPLESVGVFPLPEAEKDRFLMWIRLDYPTADQELRIVRRTYNPFSRFTRVNPVTSPVELDSLSRWIFENVKPSDLAVEYAVKICRATREYNSEIVKWGASPRAASMLTRAALVMAALDGRSYMTTSDIKAVAPHVLRHRIILQPQAVVSGVTADKVVSDVLSKVLPPEAEFKPVRL